MFETLFLLNNMKLSNYSNLYRKENTLCNYAKNLKHFMEILQEGFIQESKLICNGSIYFKHEELRNFAIF